jgi:hypothetical protein
VDLLYSTRTHLSALRDWLEDALPPTDGRGPISVVELVLPTDAVAPLVLLELGAPSESQRPRGPMMAGDQETSLVITARSVGRTLVQALELADLVRWRLVGRAGSGDYFLPMPDLAGSPVTRRWIDGAMVPDTVAGVPQASEGFVIDLQRGEDDSLV